MSINELIEPLVNFSISLVVNLDNLQTCEAFNELPHSQLLRVSCAYSVHELLEKKCFAVISKLTYLFTHSV